MASVKTFTGRSQSFSHSLCDYAVQGLTHLLRSNSFPAMNPVNEYTPQNTKVKKMDGDEPNSTPQPTNFIDNQYEFLASCGYLINENIKDIEDMWEPQFPSDDFHLQHATMNYIQYKLQCNPNPDCSIKEKLILAGFSEPTANYVEECCHENEVYQYEPLIYWISVYFEVKSKPFTLPLSSKDYLKEFLNPISQRGVWYEREEEFGRRKTLLKLQVMHMSEKQKIPDLVVNDSREPKNRVPERELWYHATYAENLNSFFEQGINLGKSKHNFDFAHTGFYLSQSLVKAKKWALNRDGRFGENYGVIFIFKINLEDYKCLDLRNDTKKWKAVVEWYRRGKNSPPDYEDLDEELDKADFLIGRASTKDCEQKDFDQLCITSLAMAKKVTYEFKGLILIHK